MVPKLECLNKNYVMAKSLSLLGEGLSGGRGREKSGRIARLEG
jgi:hypothetical protein